MIQLNNFSFSVDNLRFTLTFGSKVIYISVIGYVTDVPVYVEKFTINRNDINVENIEVSSFVRFINYKYNKARKLGKTKYRLINK